jgi:SAM-dependent methyltransferase
MPFLLLPARPARANWKGWLVYFLVILFLVSLVAYLTFLLTQRPFSALHLVVALLFLGLSIFFFKHPYFLYLLILAVPVKVALHLKSFRPVTSFDQVHADILNRFAESKERLQVLDVSTGTGNSLLRHGWTQLNADFTGLDLSETMLIQAQKFMAESRIPIELVLGDAARLPFEPETFDIVLSYGAINGLTSAKLALEEMARVTKRGGLVLFLDEQLYGGAGPIERFYFKKVLSSHNAIHRCPVELIPESLADIKVHQVYQFYYICTCYKR